MSWKAINAAWNVRTLSCSEKCVLVCMANHANASEGDLTFVSQETIAGECGLVERSVRRIQEKLKTKGHISLAESRGRATGTARFSFFVHPLTPDNGDSDTGQSQPPDRTTATATPDNGDTPNITRYNQVYPKRLTDAQGATDGATQPAAGFAHRLSPAFEKEMMARIRALLGQDEMARAGGNWRENWIRKHPAIVQSALNDLDQKLKEVNAGIARPIENRGAWLMDLCKRFKSEKTQ